MAFSLQSVSSHIDLKDTNIKPPDIVKKFQIILIKELGQTVI